MMPTVPSLDWLQYGALGVLLAVLLSVGIYIRNRDKFMEAMISNNTKRMDEILHTATGREDAHIAAWREMMTMAIKAQQDTGAVLNQLCKSVESNGIRQEARYSNLMDRLGKFSGER